METQSFGTTTERLLRAAIFMVLIDAFALMFLWDGYIGYQADNAAQLVALLGLTETQSPMANLRVTREKGTELANAGAQGVSAASIEEMFGKPSLEQNDTAYYVGQGGWLSVAHQNGRITHIDWTDGKHTVSDQAWQRYIGCVLALVSLYATFMLMKTAATRIDLTDDGVRVFGRPPIDWDAIGAVTRVGGGSVTVDVSGGKAIEIDEYRYKDAGQLVARICERKGFANPLDAA